MKKLLITILMLCGILAGCLFAACDDEGVIPVDPDTDPGTNPGIHATTSVTYTFVIGEDKVAFTAKQDKNSALSYNYSLVTYTDEWYSNEACTQPVSKATGESMTVYTSAEDISVRVVFRSENGNTNGEYTRRKGVDLPSADGIVGHDFAGWLYGETLYAAGENFSLANITTPIVEFRAKYSVQSYQITYKSEGQADKVLTQEYGSAVAAAPTYKGHVFTGWVDDEGNIVTTIEGATTLTATWQKMKYSVTVLYTEDAQPAEYEWGEVITLQPVSRTGYEYLGWQKRVDGGALVDIVGTSYLVGNDDDYDAESIVLAPNLLPEFRTVTIIGGTADSAQIRFTYNLYENLKDYEPADFSGWFYDGEYTQVLQRADTMPIDGVTVYASTGKTYTVTFNCEGNITQKTFNFNTAFTADDAVEKTGYTFNGWYTAQDELVTGVWAEDITVYAKFTINSYTITFDPGAGVGSRDDIVSNYGTQITIPDSMGFTKPYATFKGWKDDDENLYLPGQKYTVVEDITFYAVWDVTMISVTLYDWDNYVIWSGEVEAGEPFFAATLELEFWYRIDEFECFEYWDQLQINKYTLGYGSVLDDKVLEIEAYAVYMNRYTNTVLKFPDVNSLVFKYRTDSGHTNEYLISGKEGQFGMSTDTSALSSSFKGDGFYPDLHLPTTYQGKLVTGITASNTEQTGAFSVAHQTLPAYTVQSSLYVPSSYQFIGQYSFAAQQFRTLYIGKNSQITTFSTGNGLTGSIQTTGNRNLMTIYGLPSGLSRVESYGFLATSKVGFAIYDNQGNPITELPSTITYIGSYGFHGLDIFEKVDLSNVTYLGSHAFDGKKNLKEVVIGNKLTSIPDYAFRGCTEITSVNIPAQVTTIGNYAFMQYAGTYGNLSSLTFAPNSKLKTINAYAFFRCPIEKLELPEGLLSVGNAAFSANSHYDEEQGNTYYDDMLPLSKVIFPSTLQSVGTFAFASTSISEIEWGGLKIICDYAFYDTPYLKQLTLSDSITTIGAGAFQKHYSYEYTTADCFTLVISKNVEIIEDNAFKNFANITGLEFAENCALKEIGSYAFGNCINIKGELILPSQLETIGGDVFVYMGASGTVADSNTLAAAKISKIFIPKSVKDIGFCAFRYMYDLEEVVFEDNQDPNATLTLNGATFFKCSKLTSITFPCQLTFLKGGSMLDYNYDIGDSYYSGVLAYCTSLKTVTFNGRADGGDSDLTIMSCTFEGCYKITDIYILRDSYINVKNTSNAEMMGGTMLLRHSKGNFYIHVKAVAGNTIRSWYADKNSPWYAACGTNASGKIRQDAV